MEIEWWNCLCSKMWALVIFKASFLRTNQFLTDQLFQNICCVNLFFEEFSIIKTRILDNIMWPITSPTNAHGSLFECFTDYILVNIFFCVSFFFFFTIDSMKNLEFESRRNFSFGVWLMRLYWPLLGAYWAPHKPVVPPEPPFIHTQRSKEIHCW